jgi:hypothetical protein
MTLANTNPNCAPPPSPPPPVGLVSRAPTAAKNTNEINELLHRMDLQLHPRNSTRIEDRHARPQLYYKGFELSYIVGSGGEHGSASFLTPQNDVDLDERLHSASPVTDTLRGVLTSHFKQLGFFVDKCLSNLLLSYQPVLHLMSDGAARSCLAILVRHALYETRQGAIKNAVTTRKTRIRRSIRVLCVRDSLVDALNYSRSISHKHRPPVMKFAPAEPTEPMDLPRPMEPMMERQPRPNLEEKGAPKLEKQINVKREQISLARAPTPEAEALAPEALAPPEEEEGDPEDPESPEALAPPRGQRLDVYYTSIGAKNTKLASRERFDPSLATMHSQELAHRKRRPEIEKGEQKNMKKPKLTLQTEQSPSGRAEFKTLGRSRLDSGQGGREFKSVQAALTLQKRASAAAAKAVATAAAEAEAEAEAQFKAAEAEAEAQFKAEAEAEAQFKAEPPARTRLRSTLNWADAMVAITHLYISSEGYVRIARSLYTSILTADGQYCGVTGITAGQEYLLRRGMAAYKKKQVNSLSVITFLVCLIPRRFVLPFLYVLCELRVKDNKRQLSDWLFAFCDDEIRMRLFVDIIVQERILQDVFSGVKQVKDSDVDKLEAMQKINIARLSHKPLRPQPTYTRCI